MTQPTTETGTEVNRNRREDPSLHGRCPRCGAPARRPCQALKRTRYGPAGSPLTRVHPGRPWVRTAKISRGRTVDEELADRRLSVWRRRARIGDLVADIAAELGMTRVALDRFVLRARERGHPDAIYHANGYPTTPAPDRRTLTRRIHARRRVSLSDGRRVRTAAV